MELTPLLPLEEEVFAFIYIISYCVVLTNDIIILLTGIGNTGNSGLSPGGGGGRTAIQLTRGGADAVVAGGGGGGSACYVTEQLLCTGMSGTYTTRYFACDRERLVDVFLF